MAEIYSVSQINTYVKNMFAGNSLLNHVYVKGEVSNCKYHASGHVYFTLKDGAAQIACVLFAGRRAGISFRMEDGQSVIVFGNISVYERDGKYQLYADEIRRDGAGQLYEEFEHLKKRLGEEGIFLPEHKKKIPAYAEKIGIITASTGAALQDIIQISTRRNPYISLILYPAKVQGEGAADTIVKGIRALDGKADTIIVARGGGSIEDLWAFNEEKVARAIYACHTPIISAVGHETDVTISDFAADLRAPTPSAAAELAVYDVHQVSLELARKHGELAQGVLGRIEKERMLLKQAELCLKQAHPEYQLNQKRHRTLVLEEKLSAGMKEHLSRERQRSALLARRLEGVSPMGKLASGFSFVTDQNGKNIRTIEGIGEGEILNIEVTDGTICAAVVKAEKRNRG